MASLYAKKKTVKWVETIFNIAYLSTVFVSALFLLSGSEIGSTRWQFGIMALILGSGDACHLVPRIRSMWDSKEKDRTAALGIGKLIASLTMTVFYLVLWAVGANYYPHLVSGGITSVALILAALRIVLCFFPQNGWISPNPSLKWAIWRNIPFFLLGMMVAALFAFAPPMSGYRFFFLVPTVLFSFACYLPVVLFSRQHPKVGMLMLPKSCAYAAIILMGFSLSAV